MRALSGNRPWMGFWRIGIARGRHLPALLQSHLVRHQELIEI
jgi:hypothetical protein